MSTTEFNSTAKNAGIIGVTALAGAGIGFVLQLLIAYYFGAGTTTDAFFMAQSTSEMLAKLLMGGSVTAVFIPLFIERLSRGNREGAWSLGFNIINTITALYLLLLILIGIFAKPFVHFIAPGFTGETFTLTVSLLRFLLPSFLFLFLVEFATSMLHSFKQFAIPATLRLVAPAVSLICIIVFVHPLNIYALALGVLAGSLVQLAIVVWGLVRQGMRYRFFINLKDPSLRSLARLVYPFIFSVLMTQGAGIVYRILVSDLSEGSLSALKFAEKITQLITIIFLNSVTMVIYPLLSEKASHKDSEGMRTTIASSMRLIVVATLPLICIIALLREPIVSFIYERGSFTSSDAALTSIALLYLVLGLTTTGISSVLGHTVLALQETRAAVFITICSQIVAIGLFAYLTPLMGVGGLALASSLVPLSSGLLYFIYLRKRIPSLYTIFMHRTYLKAILVAIISGGVVWVATGYLGSFILPALLGIASYVACGYLFHIEEMRDITAIVMKKLNKGTV
jgi:putative peptidoglycan lipid II flippase